MDTEGTPVDLAVPVLPVRLGQLLQLANLVDSGTDAKNVIAEGLVRVDGEVERRRGRQLRGGETVRVDGAGAVRVAGP
ncbi:MAG: RNA-binding S4 domain-containing protein [Mycobacteriaceae bacterium]